MQERSPVTHCPALLHVFITGNSTQAGSPGGQVLQESPQTLLSQGLYVPGQLGRVGVQAPLSLQYFRTPVSTQVGSPGGQWVQDWPQVLPSQGL